MSVIGNKLVILASSIAWKMAGTEKKKQVKGKPRKVTVSLSERDYELLKYCADRRGTTKSILAKQMLHSELQMFKESIGGELPVKNQLSIFDSVQTDIFSWIKD